MGLGLGFVGRERVGNLLRDQADVQLLWLGLGLGSGLGLGLELGLGLGLE